MLIEVKMALVGVGSEGRRLAAKLKILLYHLATWPGASLGAEKGSTVCVMSELTVEAGGSGSRLSAITGPGHVNLSVTQFPHHGWSCS